MDENVRSRIKSILKDKNVSYTKLVGNGSAMQGKFTRQLGGAALTYDVLMVLLNAFPDVNANWLMRGEGEMYLTSTSSISNIQNSNVNHNGQQTIVSSPTTSSDATNESIQTLLDSNAKLANALVELVGKMK